MKVLTIRTKHQAMDLDQPLVSIIIPTYNEWENLSLCLKALEKQSFPQSQYEIIIVNNNPCCPLPEDIVLPENSILINEAKPGSYAARNTGLKAAKGDIIGFTDSDCIPDKDWIKNAVEFLASNKDCTRVAGKIAIPQKSPNATVLEKYNQTYAFPQKWLIKHGGGSVTANMFTYKYVFDEVGGFDDQLMSMGDKFWGIKAQNAGFQIAYAENVTVAHPSRSLAELIKKEKRHGGAVKPDPKANRLRLYFDFLYELRPRVSGVRYIFGRNRNKDRRFKDRFTIPFLRHYLLAVRAYEKLRVQLGKTPNRV